MKPEINERHTGAIVLGIMILFVAVLPRPLSIVVAGIFILILARIGFKNG